MRTFTRRGLLVGTVALLCLKGRPALAELSIEAVNGAGLGSGAKKGKRSPTMLKAQVLLDRAHVSPGVIDGVTGENTRRAIRAFQEIHGLKPNGQLNKAVWEKLIEDSADVLMRYEITKEDVRGPFIDTIPESLEEKAKLKRLAYTSPRELLAEKFHMDEGLLTALNPDVDFSKAGAKIIVARVREAAPKAKAERVVVDKPLEGVIVRDEAGKIIAYYPATIGSRSLPSPEGETRVQAVVSDPAYYYHPKLKFKGAPDRALKIAPGPNNPVGVMWIDLDREGYGLHGTPEPADVGKAFSHGCVRLTNWDAQELGKLVRKGMRVVFTGDEKNDRRRR